MLREEEVRARSTLSARTLDSHNRETSHLKNNAQLTNQQDKNQSYHFEYLGLFFFKIK